MARPPSLSVEEFQALISMTLDLNLKDHNRMSGEVQGHSRISSPNFLNEEAEFPRICEGEEDGRDYATRVELGHSDSERMRRWTECRTLQSERRMSRVGCECDCQCGCGYVGKWLGMSGRCERCERKCKVAAIDTEDNEKRILGLGTFPALPSPPHPRKRPFSLSTSPAYPSPTASHAASTGLLSRVNRVIRRISISSPNTPVSQKTQDKTPHTTPWKRTHRRSLSTAFSTHSPTLTPTKEERLKVKLEKKEEREGILIEDSKRLRSTEEVESDTKSDSNSKSRQYHYQSHYQSHPSHSQHQYQHPYPYQHPYYEQYQQNHIDSPSSWNSFESNRDSEYSPTTASEPATPVTFDSEPRVGITSFDRHFGAEGKNQNLNSNSNMLAIAPVGMQGLLTPSVEDVVGCMGSSSGDESGGERARSREREKSREREVKEREREREKSRERKDKKEKEKSRERVKEKEKEKKRSLKLNPDSSISKASAGLSTPTATPTPTKLQFSFPLGMFGPSTSGADSSTATESPGTPSSMTFGGLAANGHVSGGGSESEDQRGRKLSMLGRLRKGLSMTGRSKTTMSMSSPSTLSPSSPVGYTIRGMNVGSDVDANGIRRDSVLAREREEMERDVDLRFVNSPSPFPSLGHGEEACCAREGCQSQCQHQHREGKEESEESASLSVEVARRGVGEGGLPSVCVTFATSSASGSGSSGVCEDEEGSQSGSGSCSGSGSSGSASGRGSAGGGSKKRRRKKRRGGSANSSAGADMISVNIPQIGMRDLSSTNVSTIPSMYSMPSYVSAASTMQASTNTKTRISMQASAKTLSPRASMGTMSSPSDYSCESYMGSQSSFFAADVIERERERREGKLSNSISNSRKGGGGGGYLSTSSGGNSKKSMDGSFLSLDLSGSEGSGSDDTSRVVGVKRGKKDNSGDMDGGSFIEFGEDVDSDGFGHGGQEGEGGKEGAKGKRKRVIGMTSTPPRRDHRGKKRASVVLFRGSGSASPVKTNANGNEGNLSSSSSAPSRSLKAHQSPNSNGATSSPDGGSFKAPSIASKSDISIFSGSTHFEFAPVVESTNGSGSHAQAGRGNTNGNGKPTQSGSASGYHASDSLVFPSHHHSNQRRGMEPSIRVFDVDGDSLLNSSSSIGHGGGADAMSLSARSVDAFSVDAMSVNSDDTDYIPFLPLVLQHERLQKTLRKPVSMEAVVSANEAGRGVARSVRSVASVASMNSMASGRSGIVRSGEERDRQRRSSAVRLDPRSAHAIASKTKAAARLGISPSEVSLAAGSGSDSSKKRLPAHVSESIAGVCIPMPSNASRAPSICSSVGTEESVPVRGGPKNRASGMTLRVQTDLDLGARRVVVCGSGLDAGVEDLREGRISISSEDGAGSVVVSEDAQSQRGTIVDGDEDALEVTPTPTPRATVFAVNTLEVIPSVTSTPSTSSSKKTFIGPQQALSPQPSIGSIRRTPSRQALKATPPRAPPSDPLPLPPLSPSATSSSSSSSDNRGLLSSTPSGSVTVSSRLISDVNSVPSGASVSMVAGEREVGVSSPKAEKKVEEGKKGRMRLSVQNPKDLWRARKKASAVGKGPEPRRDATSSANLDIPTPSTPPAVLPAGNAKVGVVFPTSRSLSFSSPSSQNLHEKQRSERGVDGSVVVHQDQDRDIDDGGDEDCASILREKEGSSRSTPSSTQSDDEERASGDDNDDESIDLDSDSMRQLLAANTSANAAMHSNLDVHKIGMGRQVIIPSPPKKKKSANRLNESERLRTRSSLGVGMEWTLGLGETQLKDETTIPARHASHSGLLKKVLKPEPEPEVPSKRASRLSDAPSTSSRARTKSESALRALDSDSVRSKKTRSVLPNFNDWTLSLPLPSPRDFERSRKVSELGASIGLTSVVGEKSQEKQQTSHRHSTAPTASKRHTLDQKKRRASHHPIVRAEDVDSGVDLEAIRGDDGPSESDEDDLRTPPLNTHVAQAFVVPRVVSVVDSLGLGDSVRAKRAEVEVLDVQAETEMAEEQLEEDTHATRVKSNLAKLDALSADLKRFNELLRSGHPDSGSRKSEASLRSASSQKGSMKGPTPLESHPDPGPFSYSIKLKHVRSCEPFESNEPTEDTQTPPKNALFRTSCANLRESVLSSLPASDNESGNEGELEEAEGDMSDLSISTLRQRTTSQGSMKRRSQPRISLSKSRSSLSPVIQLPSAAEEDINCSTIDVMDVGSQPTGFTANAVFGPAKWGKSSSLGRSALPGQPRTYARAPLPFAPPVESTIAASSTTPLQNTTNERRPKKLSDGIADISPTLRNAVSSIELGRMVPIPALAPKKSAVHIGEQRETAKLAPPQAPSSKKLAVPLNLSVQIAPMRRSSIILSDMTPTSATSSAFPTPLASSFPIPPNTLPSLPLDFELGAKRMAQIVPPTPPAPVQDSSRSIKSQKGRPSTSSSTSTVTESVVQRMKERLESLGKNASKAGTPAPTSPAAFGEPEDTDQSSLCSGAYYSARSSFSEERRGD